MNDDLDRIIDEYGNMVKRIAFLYLKNKEDVEDVFQEVFLKFVVKKVDFESKEHEKAFIIRVTINKCKDVLKSYWYRNTESINERIFVFEDKKEDLVIEVVKKLPDKYKIVLYLYYYEEKDINYISKALNKRQNTIYSLLHRARKLLKKELGGSEYEYNL